MTATTARYLNGKIVLAEPVDWPDGSEVEVRLRSQSTVSPQDNWDGEQDNSPEAIQRWIAELDAIPRAEMTDEEWSAWQTRRNEDKQVELQRMDARIDRLIDQMP